GVGERLAAALAERGEAARLAVAGEGFQPLPDGRYAVDPARPEALARLVAESPGGWRGCVYLWPLDAGLEEPAGPEAMLAAQQRVTGGALHLVQALLRGQA